MLGLGIGLMGGLRKNALTILRSAFANGEIGGYWPMDTAGIFQASNGTTAGAADAVVGYVGNAIIGGPAAVQTTTANKPYLRRTPVSGKYWLDGNSNTATLNATFPGSIRKLYASDAATSDQFGNAIAVNADATIALIAAYADDDTATATGSVYVWTRFGDTWTQQQKLHASDATANDYFGSSVALNADATIALIGAYFDDDGISSSGSVYVFTRSGDAWTQQQKLHADDAVSGRTFGSAVALNADGTIAIIGAVRDDDTDTDAGAAYVFTRSGDVWTQQQKLFASDGTASDYFGNSAAISADGSIALIGAYSDDEYASSTGTVYVFVRSGDTWIQKQKLFGSFSAGSDFFGISVALNADASIALIGAHGRDDIITGAGCAYVFKRVGDVWREVQILHAFDAANGANFGYGVALNAAGTMALIGAINDSGSVATAGAVYVLPSLETARLDIDTQSVEWTTHYFDGLPYNIVAPFTYNSSVFVRDTKISGPLTALQKTAIERLMRASLPALGPNLVDDMMSPASWTLQGANTIETDADGALKFTYVDNTTAGVQYFRAASGLASDLAIGRGYRFSYDVKVTGSISSTFDAGASPNLTPSRSYSDSVYDRKWITFVGATATGDNFKYLSFGPGEIAWFKNPEFREIL